MASAKATQKICNGHSSVFAGFGCFKGIFSLQVKDDVKQFQALPRLIVCALQEPFKKQFKRLQEHQILAPLG